MSIDLDLGEFLKGLRRKAGISPTEAARRSGVSRMTLYRWENGQNVPREFELRAALTGYDVAPARRAEILSLRERNARRLLTPDAPSVAFRVSRGDLLAALRGRAGLTQTELAARAALPRARLNSWEHRLSWPDDATVHRLAYHLNVTSDELLALTVAPPERTENDDDSLDYFFARVTAILTLWPPLEECEMEIHSLMARLRVRPAPEAEYEIWYLEYGYACLLTFATRFREGIRWLKRADARALPVRVAYDAAWPVQARAVVERATLRRAHAKRRREAGKRQLGRQNALSHFRADFSASWEAAHGLELAMALHLQGDDDSALRTAGAAFVKAAEQEDSLPEARLHRYGDLLAATERNDIILNVFPRYLGRSAWSDAHIFYYMGVASRAVGNAGEADDFLTQALAASETYGRRLLTRDIRAALVA